MLLLHAVMVTPGASVERATVVAVAYLVARTLEVNTSPWQVLSVAVVGVVIAQTARPVDPSEPVPTLVRVADE